MKPVAKVWLYIIRRHDEKPELLVFEHLGVDAGIQVPAGTVEAGETLEAAARRELLEESGIRLAPLLCFGKLRREWQGQDVQAHWFWQQAPPLLPDEWVHHVTGSGEDNGMHFRCHWLPRTEWHKLFGDFKLAYPALEQALMHSVTAETK